MTSEETIQERVGGIVVIIITIGCYIALIKVLQISHIPAIIIITMVTTLFTEHSTIFVYNEVSEWIKRRKQL